MFRAAQQIIQGTAEKVQAEAQSLAPIKSGALRNSITVRYVGALSAVIGPQVNYGVYQEFGTGTRGEFPTASYTITPKKGQYLSFNVNGKKVVTRKVTHPGIPARPYMRPALANVLGDQMAAQMAEKGTLLITKGRTTS
jgi:HK97 gp10 family phage protein